MRNLLGMVMVMADFGLNPHQKLEQLWRDAFGHRIFLVVTESISFLQYPKISREILESHEHSYVAVISATTVPSPP